MPKKVLLSGYFGFGNIGDEAVLESECAELRRLNPDIEISVLMDNKERAAELGVTPYKRKSFFQIYKAIKNADLIISGGGGLFQDSTGFASVMYYGSILAGAVILNKPSFLFSQGFGPIKTSLGRMFAQYMLPLASKASFRDADSLKEFKEFAPDVEAEVTADPVFLFPHPSEDKIKEIVRKCGLEDNKQPLAVFVVRNWFGLNIAQLAEGLNKWGEKCAQDNPKVLIVPFQYWFDEGISRRLNSLIKIDSMLCPELKADEIMALFAHSDVQMIASMRLHALIMGASLGKSVLGISYDPKVERLCSLCNAPCTPFEGISADKLSDFMESGWKNRKDSAAAIGKNAAELRKKAGRAAEMALELL